MDSILTTDRPGQCLICGSTENIELHHIFFGTANRKVSDRLGLTCHLCREHHTGNSGVHFCPNMDITLKITAEESYIYDREAEGMTREQAIDQFRKEIGKNYVDV